MQMLTKSAQSTTHIVQLKSSVFLRSLKLKTFECVSWQTIIRLYNVINSFCWLVHMYLLTLCLCNDECGATMNYVWTYERFINPYIYILCTMAICMFLFKGSTFFTKDSQVWLQGKLNFYLMLFMIARQYSIYLCK